MTAKQLPPTNVVEYIAKFPAHVQSTLEQIRAMIRTATPQSEEIMRYGTPPAYQLHGKLVEFAACKKYLGFYPRRFVTERSKAELSAYRSQKSTLQFPLDQPIPYKLIERIVKFRVKENFESTVTESK